MIAFCVRRTVITALAVVIVLCGGIVCILLLSRTHWRKAKDREPNTTCSHQGAADGTCAEPDEGGVGGGRGPRHRRAGR